MAEREVRKLSAVMFTDIQGYTAFVQADEKEALNKVATHRKHLEDFTAHYNGRVIAFYGDGSLSIYESALDAVHCGIAMQKAYQAEHPIPVRIGIHVGDIVFRDETVYGDGVNIASRLQTSGIPGSVYISDRVRAELANHPEIKTKSVGFKKLKNVKTPIEIFVITNDGLAVPKVRRVPGQKKLIRFGPLLIIAVLVWWLIARPYKSNPIEKSFTDQSISVPLFSNNTGDPKWDHIAQMASHWITKELSSSSNANVVSYESASENIKLAGVSLNTKQGKDKYASLTGAVNIVNANYTIIGTDKIQMSGYIENIVTGNIKPLKDVECSSTNPMDCIKKMSSNIKGYWVSRGDKILTAPNYEAYKAYLAARSSWLSPDKKEFVIEQLNKAISLDSNFLDPYFLMLDNLFNEGEHAAAADMIVTIRKKFPDLDDERQINMLYYHTADVEGRNEDAYNYFLGEYKEDSTDLFTNNSAMVIALMYRNKPLEALRYFNAIPIDSLHIDGCTYCGQRLELGLWAALNLDSMALADRLAPKLRDALYKRQSYGMLIMYDVWKKDTTEINLLLKQAETHVPELDKDWEYLVYLTGRLFLLRGDTTLANLYAQKSIDVHQSIKGRMLGRSYYLNNQFDKALLYYKEAIKKDPDDAMFLSELGMVYARMGNIAETQKIIKKLETLRTDYEYGATEYYQGRLYALLGDLEQATSLFNTSLQKGRKFEMWVTFIHDPDLFPLRDYPGYVELISR